MNKALTKQEIMAQAQPLGRGANSQATNIEQSRAVAEVQAMVVVARNAPRIETAALAAVKQSCGMMAVAERAFFKFPRGGQSVSGETIHLARELARCWGNISYGIKELDRDDIAAHSEMLAYAWDVQTNARSEITFIVPHKRDKKGGADVLTDLRDIYENNANNGARRLREMIFNVMPPWLIEEARTACYATLEAGESAEPLPVRIAKMLEVIEAMGISRERVEAKTGKPADALSAQELAAIGVALRSIKRGEVTAEDEFPPVAAQAITAALKAQAKPAEQPRQDDESAPVTDTPPVHWTFTDTAGKLKTVKTEGDFIVALKSALIGLGHAPTAVGKLMAANAEMLDRLEATSQQDWAALRTQARDGGWEG